MLSSQPLMAKDMSQEKAIKIIQVAERARQGRLRAKLNEESRNMNRMYRTKEPGTDAIESATVCIQKVLHHQHNPTCLCLSSLMLKDLLNLICRCGGATCRGRGQRLFGKKKWFFWEWWVKSAIHFTRCLKLQKWIHNFFTKLPLFLIIWSKRSLVSIL